MFKETDLPDDTDALKAMIIAQAVELAAKDAVISQKDAALAEKEDCITRLEALVKAFRAAMFGRRSEKLDPDQYDLALEDIEVGIVAIAAEDTTAAQAVEKVRQPKSERASLPKHLPRIDEVIEPESTVCDCGHEMHAIGEDISERLDVIPAQFRVIVTHRPRYACRTCQDGIRQAPAPSRLIPGGLPTEAWWRRC